MNSKVIDLKKEMGSVEGGIASKTIRSSRDAKVVLFRFDSGQRLSEHTSTVAASIQIVEGLAIIKLGGRSVDATPGTWIDMEPGLPHAILAKTPVTMLLTLFHREKHLKTPRRSAAGVKS